MAMTSVWRATTTAIAALAMVLATAGCATPTQPAGGSAGVRSATTLELLTTRDPMTVIERDGRAQLCVGVVQPYPPACAGGVDLTGWDWGSSSGVFEEHADVRWGDFTVTGTFDVRAGVFTVASVTPASEAPVTIEEEPLFPSRCLKPDGGWEVLDESTATDDALHAANSLIPTLEGYATAWIDRSRIPPIPPGADALEQMRFDAVHAGLSIVNLGVHGDPSAAEVAVRRVWGGALCVFTVDYTIAAVEALQQRIMDEHAVFSSTIDPITGVIGLTVVFDADGELQRRMDHEYGPGRVAVSSVLMPL